MVFAVSVILALLIVIGGLVHPEGFASGASALLSLTTEKFGWFFLLSTFGFLLFALSLAFGRFGSVRLGRDEDVPEYSDLTWFAMLFSAGMGIGLVFWGVAEPLSHYVRPPPGAEGQTAEAARLAMRFSFFHWGLHAWAIYTVIGLAIAYFSFRKGQSGLISSTFAPLQGARIHGPLGKGIDVLATLATAFGVATSLGLGTLQINSGLARLTGLPQSLPVQLGIISLVTVLYLLSATTGLDRGIKLLSNANLTLAVGLLVFVLFAGPTSFIFDVFTSTLGAYLQNLVQMSLRLTPFSAGSWIKDWTLFYWAWWIAWAPFVGLFIARVSRGRTIREFVLGVLLVPSIFSLVWFSVFGGTALKMEMFDQAGLVGTTGPDVTAALFQMLERLPLGGLLAALATLLIITFFITSADSATFVLGMLSSNGRLNPSSRVKVLWGVLQSAIAAVLLLSGGLKGLQTASIITAAPFAVIMVLMCISVRRALLDEERAMHRTQRAPSGSASSAPGAPRSDVRWRLEGEREP
ncbi:BCCT family transporter [Pyxidicoccus fallax]|uniref:BCCT family transporter n=1 Tax=Pyxidicoccus fallax TaxID=394095 RepID=A0A848LM55_9BACT|nr:BCCT family transporter [Pyxidicoccus fallax]NMO18723.1 BCCT family transporter [Pyxidicoccus fallax]NPC79304.1 BCCT family transporter [Pyxidicoccus fallax]